VRGDGRIGNALGGSSATCPGCHGSGRRVETSYGFHDVTKDEAVASSLLVATSTGPKGPTTSEGVQLALEVSASPVLAEDAKNTAARGDHEPREHARTMHPDLHQEDSQADSAGTISRAKAACVPLSNVVPGGFREAGRDCPSSAPKVCERKIAVQLLPELAPPTLVSGQIRVRLGESRPRPPLQSGPTRIRVGR